VRLDRRLALRANREPECCRVNGAVVPDDLVGVGSQVDGVDDALARASATAFSASVLKESD
jgi:hypothetical protein